MPTAKKEAAVAELTELIQRANAVIVTDYRGLRVADINRLRRQLREKGSEYRVVKNTLTSLAAQNAGVGGLISALEGPTALAISFDDPVATAKVLSDFARVSRILQIRAGLLGERVISGGDVEELASIEPREVLLSRMLGGFNSPIASLVGVLNATISSIAYVLQARVDQLGGESAAATQ